MSSITQWRRDNAVELARLGFERDEIDDLQAAARTAHRISENACNGYHSEEAEKRDEARDKRALAKVTEIAKAHGFKVYEQGDPRGWPYYLYRQKDLDRYYNEPGVAERMKGYRHPKMGALDSNYNRIAVVSICPH